MSGSRLFDLITRWRLTPAVVITYALVSIVGALIALEPGDGEWAVVVSASLLATLAALTVLVAGTAMVRAILGTWSVGAWFLVVASVVGMARAIVLNLTGGGGADVGILVNSTLSAVAWLGLAGLLAAGQEAYRDRYRAIVGEAAELDLDAHPGMQQMRSTLSSAIAAAQRDPSPEQWTRASEAIRAEITSTLRPLSHRLWFGKAEEEPHARWTRVVLDAVAGFTVPVPWVMLMWVAGSLIGGASLFGPQEAATASVLSSIILLASLLLGRVVVRSRPVPIVGWVTVILASLLPIVVADAVMSGLGFAAGLSWDSGLGPLLWLALAGLIVLSASVSLAASDRRTVLAAAASAHNSAEGRVSSYLHNSLQSELTGMAMQLDGAARADDAMAARVALKRVQALLSRSLSEDLAAFHEEPIARAARVAQAWSGICDVTIEIDPNVGLEAGLTSSVAAVEELISNAVRHTGASVAHVSITRGSNGRILVTCRADTPGREPTGSGLGSTLLSAVAAAGVDVRLEGDSTVYALEIGASRRA